MTFLGIVLLVGNCLLPVLEKIHSGFPDFWAAEVIMIFLPLGGDIFFFLAAFSIASLLHFLVMEKVSGKV